MLTFFTNVTLTFQSYCHVFMLPLLLQYQHFNPSCRCPENQGSLKVGAKCLFQLEYIYIKNCLYYRIFANITISMSASADELKATVKETWASIPPQQCHKLITSMPRRIEAVIKAKGAPPKYWVHMKSSFPKRYKTIWIVFMKITFFTKTHTFC